MDGFTVIAEGLAFPEGPVVMADGSVIVVEVFGGVLTRCWNGRKEVIARPGDGPNGALYLCNNGGITPEKRASCDRVGRIERVDLATGRVEQLYDSCDGRPIGAPNDLMFDSAGNMWFTDMGRLFHTGKEFGGIYVARPDGSAITRVAENMLSPNGIGISPDGRHVYAADTFNARVWRVDNRAEAQEPLLLATVPGHVGLDSLAMSAAGNVCVATIGHGARTTGAITAVTPEGAIAYAVETPDPFTTNVAFGGSDGCDAWITLSRMGQLVHRRWPEPGLELAYRA